MLGVSLDICQDLGNPQEGEGYPRKRLSPEIPARTEHPAAAFCMYIFDFTKSSIPENSSSVVLHKQNERRIKGYD